MGAREHAILIRDCVFSFFSLFPFFLFSFSTNPRYLLFSLRDKRGGGAGVRGLLEEGALFSLVRYVVGLRSLYFSFPSDFLFYLFFF